MPFDKERFEGLAGFRLALRQFLAVSEAICREGGVTAQQYQAMLALGCGAAPMSVKELADQLLLQQHGATQMADRLESAGLITRAASPTDGRSVILSLTDTGEALLSRLAEEHLAEILRQEPKLSASLRRLRAASRTN